ncbi:MAG TPA: FAD-dependent monooxygenase [Polyangiaceae bacterium]|nr:FAD-dependent monooxygenase [Polyangiaceae bacterium]
MRVACVGGGPAGLFLALLLARTGRHRVDVFDRDVEGATYGFGVVFSRLSLARLRAAAKDVMDELLEHGVSWQSVEVRARGATATSHGHGFCAVERRAMLRVLRKHAAEAGAQIFQPWPVESTSAVKGYDVIVAADGAASRIRRQMADDFRPSIRCGSSRYVWFGLDRAFECMTFLLAEGPHGPMGAHVYPYSRTASTFLVEAPEEVWSRAGFGAGESQPPGWTDERALRYCEEVFASELGGGSLIGNGSRCLGFAEVRNERWSASGVVLLGDAAHTAHFSVGSGTSMAMEDAVELTSCLSRFSDVSDAFMAYEAARRPAVAGIQTAAWASSQFWEHLENEAGRDIDQTMLRLLTRTGQADLDLLYRIDPGLISKGRRASTLESGEATIAVPSGRGRPWQREQPTAALVESHEIDALEPGPAGTSAWAALALVVNGATCGAEAAQRAGRDLAELRRRSPAVPVGVYYRAQGTESAQADFTRAAASATALGQLTRPDFVAIGCTDTTPASQTMQMTLCDFVRSTLNLPTIYACLPARLGHARTHVEAARADAIWVIHGAP